MVEVSAENITLVTVITFLSAFFILCMLIPSGLVTGNNVQGRSVNVPVYFEGMDIQNFAQTYTVNLTSATSLEEYEFNLGGWEFLIQDYEQPDSWITVRTQSKWWIFRWDFRYFRWYDCKGIEKSVSDFYGGYDFDIKKNIIYYSALDEAYSQYGKDGLKWILKNDVAELVVFVGFNRTKYSMPSEALNNGDLSLLFCINFDKINTSFNAWNLVGSFLFFQMPNVHPTLNMLFAIPVWILIAWLIYILILKAIPFVGG
jgi:hypothetical protein